MNRLRICLSAGILASCFLSQLAEAQRGYVVSSSQNQVQSARGGYLPLTVTVSTSDGKPVTNDVKFNLCIQYGYMGNRSVYSTPLEISAGRSNGSATLYHLVSNVNSYSQWWIERDRNLRRDQRDLFSQGVNFGVGGYASSNYLFVSSSVTRPAPVGVLARGGSMQRTSANLFTSDIGENLPSFEVLARLIHGEDAPSDKLTALNFSSVIETDIPSQLPSDWIGLTSIQHVFISIDDLQNLNKNYPEKLNALRQWISAGGRLIVSECGENCKKANAIFKALELQPASRPEWKRLSNQGWKNHWPRQTITYGYNTEFLRNEREKRYDFLPSLELVPQDSDADSRRPQVYQLGQGQLLATTDDMSDWNRKDWRWLLATMEVTAPEFHSLIGDSTLQGSAIPGREIAGVREPPKSSFQVLILCFVFIAGPLNYFVLKKSRKLNALLITVPLISLAACLSLFGYAILFQGFGVKVRHDSLTFLDQRNQVAVTRGTHNIFSGLHPGRYTVSKDRFVLVGTSNNDPSFVRFEGNEISFSGGNIQARSPHQISTVDPYVSNEGLRFSNKDNQLRVKSDFSDDLELLLVNYEGKRYRIEGLEAGQVATATPVNLGETKRSFIGALEELTEFQRIPRMQEYWGFNNHIVDGAITTPLEQENIYMAVFRTYRGAAPICDEIERLSGSHVIIGKW